MNVCESLEISCSAPGILQMFNHAKEMRNMLLKMYIHYNHPLENRNVATL